MDDPSNNPPRASVLTPAGRGAIAVVAVTGEGCVQAVDRYFHAASGKSLDKTPVGRIAFGRWGDGDGEEVVVTRGDQSVEVHCHGGAAASRAIVESLAAGGCEAIDQQTWLESTAFDAIEAAALQALGNAVTERAALVLLDQFHGALRTAIEQVVDHIDIDALDEADIALHHLLNRRTLGERLTTPASVVLTGPPNVGKSSLINALVGYERAIVFDTPGTTRDVVTATTAVDGWAVELIDTAGLRDAASGIEQAGIELARQVITDSNLVVRVAEAKTWLAGDPPKSEFDAWIADKPRIEVASKVDLLDEKTIATLQQQQGNSLIVTSAVQRHGVDELLRAIGTFVNPKELKPGSAVPYTNAQFDSLQEALANLATGNPGAAKQALVAMLAK